jgi:hypothetical protein
MTLSLWEMPSQWRSPLARRIVSVRGLIARKARENFSECSTHPRPASNARVHRLPSHGIALPSRKQKANAVVVLSLLKT